MKLMFSCLVKPIEVAHRLNLEIDRYARPPILTKMRGVIHVQKLV